MARISRRHFLEEAARAGVGVAAVPLLDRVTWAAAAGANDRIRVAVMGVRGRGRSHVAALLAQPNLEIAYLCDVDKEAIGPMFSPVEKAGGKAPVVVQDIRKVLEDKTIDAV